MIKGYSQASMKNAQSLGDRQLVRRLQTIDEQAQRLRYTWWTSYWTCRE